MITLCYLGAACHTVLIWQFGSLEKIAKINSANIKPHDASRQASQVPGILCTVPILQEKYLYTLNLCC